MKSKIGKYLEYMFVVLCIITISVFILTPIRENNNEYSFSIPNTSVTCAPIDIDGNAALDAWAAVNSPGTDGLSWATAHVIENCEIDASVSNYGISIANTDRYLIIQNCETSNAPSSAGIIISLCQNIFITESYSHDNGDEGIRVTASYNMIFSDNILRRNSWGIAIRTSENCTISNNIAKDNLDGFDILNCVNLNISGNTASNNDWTGIFVDNGDNSTICDNTVTNNDEHNGIYLDVDSEYNEVYDNIVCGNNPFNILDEGQNNNIYNNTFSCPKEETIPGYHLVWIIGFGVVSLAIIFIKGTFKNKNSRINKNYI